MTPVEELRAAADRLGAGEVHLILVDTDKDTQGQGGKVLREFLAAWLRREADSHFHIGGVPQSIWVLPGMDKHPAVAVARAINGSDNQFSEERE